MHALASSVARFCMYVTLLELKKLWESSPYSCKVYKILKGGKVCLLERPHVIVVLLPPVILSSLLHSRVCIVLHIYSFKVSLKIFNAEKYLKNIFLYNIYNKKKKMKKYIL